jgi:hypothetical protein
MKAFHHLQRLPAYLLMAVGFLLAAVGLGFCLLGNWSAGGFEWFEEAVFRN